MLRIAILLITVVMCGVPAWAQNVNTLQRIPNLKSLPDVTQQLQTQINTSGGSLVLDGAEYFRITAPLVFDLAKLHAVKVTGTGGATLIMDGPGPALQLLGTHEGTASPKSFQPATWNERMPIVSDIELLGSHPEADGIQLRQTVEPVIRGVAIRWCRHGIHLVERNRNVVIADCQLYENSGIGVFLDDVNLHQINVGNSHISYNRQGGIVVRDGNVRNLQVHGCDVEANMPADETATSTANILIDVSGSADDKTKSVAEISITGCTIQHSANYSRSENKTVAPGGANIRLAGKEIYPIDSVTITGNVLSDTTANISIDYALDVAISANNFFAPKPVNLEVSNSKRVVVSGNTFHPRQFDRPGTIRFTNTDDSLMSACVLHRFATGDGALILNGCSGMTLNALNVSDCDSGIVLRNSADVTISSCRVTRTASGGFDLQADATNQRLLLSGNSFGGAVSVNATAVEQPTAQ